MSKWTDVCREANCRSVMGSQGIELNIIKSSGLAWTTSPFPSIRAIRLLSTAARLTSPPFTR